MNPSNRITRAAVIGALFAGGLSPVHGRWSPHPTQHNPIATGPGFEAVSDMAPDTRGGLFASIVESSYRNETVYYRVLAQHVAGNSDQVWGNGIQLDEVEQPDSGAAVYDPLVVPDNSGGVLTFWSGVGTAGRPQARVQRLNAEGVSQWAAPLRTFTPAATATGQWIGHAISDQNGGAIVTLLVDGKGYVQRVGVDGTRPWSGDGVQLLATNATDPEQSIRLAEDGEGGALVAHVDFVPEIGSEATPNNLRVQRLGPSGNKLWGPSGVLVAQRSGANYQILSDGSGGAYVFWWDDGQTEMRMQRVSAAGAPLWQSAVSVGAVAESRDSALLPDGRGGALAVWTDNPPDMEDALGLVIRAQRISPLGAPIWAGGGRLVFTGAGLDLKAVTAALGGGILTWTQRDASQKYRVIAQQVDPSGGLRWGPNGIPVTATATHPNVWNRDVITDGRGGALAGFAVRDVEFDPSNSSEWDDSYCVRFSAAGIRGGDGISFFNQIQRKRISTEWSGWQVVRFSYYSQALSVTPYAGETGSFQHLLPPEEWSGLYMYDYGSARFTQAVYYMRDRLE